ncbi:MAG TPA: hypothetical protein VMT85_25360 [Thermoanaerobaculia bacterium]|nr:hypothetical protein [Thermoanaerobaculia bacterium]
MIAFVTLLLGLVTGTHTLELLVGPGVAAVELRFDGETVARLEGEPWIVEHDFGAELAPHRLEAVAFDADGNELERAVQWVNLPRPSAEVSLVLDASADGRGSRARLSWESLAAVEPDRFAIALDGQPLEVSDPTEFELPPYDPQQLHFLRAEVDFGGTVSGVAELTFGGFYAEEVNSELMALPITVEGRDPSLEELHGAFESEGETLQAVALDHGAAEVVVVRDLRAREQLADMARSSAFVPIHFGRNTRTRFLWATATLRGDETRYRLFPASSELDLSRGRLLAHLVHLSWPGSGPESQRLADSVAVAGLTAVRQNRRRSVVLVLGERAEDRSQLTPERVRRYLGALGVPLHVWSAVADQWQGAGWGPVEDVSTIWKLEAAARSVRKGLERQRLIWFDGTHLPQRISLRRPIEGVELVR